MCLGPILCSEAQEPGKSQKHSGLQSNYTLAFFRFWGLANGEQMALSTTS